MLLVVGLLLAGRDIEVASDLVAHHLLRDDLVADVLLEILVADALLPGGLFERLHVWEIGALADLIQLPDHLGIAVDPEFLPLGQQDLLVDHVAQKGVLFVGELGGTPVVLLALLHKSLLGAFKFSTRDDLVVYPRNHVLNDGSVGGDGFGRGELRNLRRVEATRRQREVGPLCLSRLSGRRGLSRSRRLPRGDLCRHPHHTHTGHRGRHNYKSPCAPS